SERARCSPYTVVVIAHALAVGWCDAGEAVALRAFGAGSPGPGAKRAGGLDRFAIGSLTAAFDQRFAAERAAATRHDLDDAPRGAGAIGRAWRSGDDRDVIDISRGEVPKVEPAAERVHPHTVDQHERVVGAAASRKDRGDRAAAAAARHGESRH